MRLRRSSCAAPIAPNRCNEAVFWFYAGQLRARYSPKLKGENSQLVLIFAMMGEPINAHAQSDILGMEKTIERVLAWDTQTFDVWAAANAYDPSNEKLIADRAKVREGLVGMMEELKSKREQYEKIAREYKSPEEQQREAQQEYAKRIEKSFSTRLLERVVEGKMFRLPANYFTRLGLEEPGRNQLKDLTLTVFLPEFAGFTKNSPLELGGNKSVMWVRINDPNEVKNALQLFEAFIATKPPTVRVFGAEAYLFDVYKNPAKVPLPLYGYMNEYVFRHNGPKGELVYMSCQAPISNIHNPNPQCRLFMRHSASGLRVNATFSQVYGENWVQIVDRLYGFLDAWYVAN
jgi:hypothetical protein